MNISFKNVVCSLQVSEEIPSYVHYTNQMMVMSIMLPVHIGSKYHLEAMVFQRPKRHIFELYTKELAYLM